MKTSQWSMVTRLKRRPFTRCLRGIHNRSITIDSCLCAALSLFGKLIPAILNGRVLFSNVFNRAWWIFNTVTIDDRNIKFVTRKLSWKIYDKYITRWKKQIVIDIRWQNFFASSAIQHFYRTLFFSNTLNAISKIPMSEISDCDNKNVSKLL